MPLIANLTLAQLRAATKAQIITGISNWLTNNLTKRQLIAFLLDAEVLQQDPIRTFRADGQISTELLITTDAETGAELKRRSIEWSYYPTGEVDTITITEGTVTRRIKHYLDGRQPMISANKSARPANLIPVEVSNEDPADMRRLQLLAIFIFVLLMFLFLAFGGLAWLTRLLN